MLCFPVYWRVIHSGKLIHICWMNETGWWNYAASSGDSLTNKSKIPSVCWCQVFSTWDRLGWLYQNDSSSVLLYFFFFCLFRAAHTAYGGSQARGRIGAVAAGFLSRICNLHHSSWQHWIFNPLSKARDQTIFMDTCRMGYRWGTMGTPPTCEFLTSFFVEPLSCWWCSWDIWPCHAWAVVLLPLLSLWLCSIFSYASNRATARQSENSDNKWHTGQNPRLRRKWTTPG